MATYATYRHVELDRVGLGKRRVLKPPGGGSSISFEEDDSFTHIKGKSPPQSQASPTTDNKESQQSPKPETNGTSSPPQTPKDNDSSSTAKENSPSTASTTTTATTNGTVNGILTNGTSTSGSSTPNSSRLDTQNRLFGEDPQKDTPNRRVRDHHRSNIFSNAADAVPAKAVFRRPWTRRDPVTGVGVTYWDLHAPRWAPIKRKANPANSEPKTPEDKASEAPTPQPQPQPQVQAQPQPQVQQRQRIPPGGFSTKLW